MHRQNKKQVVLWFQADFLEQREQRQRIWFCRVVTRSRKILEQNFAEIAQLVEHDLAKVGVASSSLVFRSRFFQIIKNLANRKRTFRSSERKTNQDLFFRVATKSRKNEVFAEIAQLVEHDLAKVGVASSSLVFRSDISA